MNESPASRRSRFLRPAVALPVLGAVVVLVALLTPQPVDQGRGGASTYSRSETGGQLIYELAQRMGWRVGRRLAPLDTAIEASVVHVVLAPREDLGAHEVHHLLESVRRGGALIASAEGGSTLADSLHVGASRLGRYVPPAERDECGAGHERRVGPLATPPVITGIAWRGRAPTDLQTFATVVARPGDVSPAAVGFTLGRGRIALVSDAELFTNDVVRVCPWRADVVVARIFEYVRRDAGTAQRTTLVFDEYHHGYGTHPGSLRAISWYLFRTASGHMFVQVLAAGLLLLIALAPRPIVPRDPERVVRRSPLEHADALAHAYAEVGATKTIVARLLDGLRRRAGRYVASAPDTESFLYALGSAYPELGGDVSRVRSALHELRSPRELVSVVDSLRRIEDHLTPPRGR